MRLLKYSEITEKSEGWLHGVLVEVRPGVEVIIVDDTRNVSAFSKKGGGKVTLDEVREAWGLYHLGASNFPGVGRNEGESVGNKFGYNPAVFGWVNGYDDIGEYIVKEMNSEAMFDFEEGLKLI